MEDCPSRHPPPSACRPRAWRRSIASSSAASRPVDIPAPPWSSAARARRSGRRASAALTGRATAAASSPTETIYDLASLTKVIGTTTAVMILFDEGQASTSTPRSCSIIPEFTGGVKDSVTVRHAARASLGPCRQVATSGASRTRPTEARAAVISTRRSTAAGPVLRILRPRRRHARHRWSKRVTGQRLDVFLHERVFAPLGMPTRSSRPTRLASRRASRRPSSRRRAAIRCRARCTTRTPTRWAASPATRGCSAPPPISRSSRR